MVSFVNEQGMLEAGLDYGGLVKEFLEQVVTAQCISLPRCPFTWSGKLLLSRCANLHPAIKLRLACRRENCLAEPLTCEAYLSSGCDDVGNYLQAGHDCTRPAKHSNLHENVQLQITTQKSSLGARTAQA